MIPIDGELRHDIGLLGSPSFEIPRSVNSRQAARDLSRKQFRRRLTGKNRHNIATMAIYLLLNWVRLYVTLLLGFTTVDLYQPYGIWALVGGTVVAAVFNFFWSVVIERAATGFRRLQPQFCSIYEPYFWWHERFWKLSTQPAVFNGTPFKAIAWRMLGVPTGRRLFDDGASMSEKTLVRLGDDCTLNAGVVLQAHSMEDGVFKSDHIAVGSGVLARRRVVRPLRRHDRRRRGARARLVRHEGHRGADPGPVAGQPGAGGRGRGAVAGAHADLSAVSPPRGLIGSRT